VDGLYTFGCIPQRFEFALAEILRYANLLFIYLSCPQNTRTKYACLINLSLFGGNDLIVWLID
jgi:hypothetical protein